MIDPTLLDSERMAFEWDVAKLFDGDVLKCIAFSLDVWSKMLPQTGSLAARCKAMADALDRLPREEKGDRDE